MMKTFLLEIITPERIAYTGPVEMVTASSVSGEIGILAGHVPLFSQLKEGEVKITKNGEEAYLAIGGGFLEVTPQKTTILVTSAYHADEINEKEVLEAKKRAEEILAAKPEGSTFIEAQTQFNRAMIAMKVMNRKKTHYRNIT